MTEPTVTEPTTIPVEAADYRTAMARIASAVHLVTTDGLGGRAGFTATAVCSVSDEPPTLLVCVNRTASAHAALSVNDTLCVNTLGAHQTDVAGAFGGRTPMDDRFAIASWSRLATGSPVLDDARVAFDCRIVGRHAVATHDVLVCEVVALARAGTGDGLLYADRRYHAPPLQAPARDDAA